MNPGDRLGHFEILGPLGAGGMGEVYRARDARLGRDVAIKVLPPRLSADPEVRARFEREARTVSGLNHPHICTLFDIGREGDTDFLVMELVEGETLAKRLERGPLPLDQVLQVGEQIADALARAHRAGIVHRDLKPGNVMLTRTGAKLLDFGLARPTGLRSGNGGASPSELAHSPTVSRPLTAEGTIVGTFQYMAPEQLEGKEADTRSDVWALGCLLHEMTTGERAFTGKSQASLIAAILDRPPPSILVARPTSPPALDRLVQACLAKDPDERVQAARDVQLHLAWLRADSSDAGHRARAAPNFRARRARLALLAALAVTLAGAAFMAGRQFAGRADSAPMQFTRRTFRPQAIFGARFMPDGRTLVLSAALEGNRTRLFVIRPEYPEPQPIGDQDVHLLAVSSRGELAVLDHARYTGHHRLFDGTLARMPLEGGAPRDIMEGVREADWSPDGQNLAIIHEAGGRDRLEFPIGKVLYESAGYLSDPRVSPRGDRIAFMEHPAKYDDRGSIAVVDLAGHVQVLAGGYWGMEGLAWSPKGTALYYSAAPAGGGNEVYEARLRGRARESGPNLGFTIHDIAPDGTWAVTRDDLPFGIAYRSTGAADDADLSWLDNSSEPVLSGDGKTLAFTDQSAESGPNYAVTLRPTTGGAIVRLGEGSAIQFSADGRSVLAVVFSSPPRLMTYPVGAGEATRLDHGEFQNLSAAHWIGNGPRVLVDGNQPGEPARCFLLDPQSGRADPVGPEGIWGSIPSPDGTSFIAQTPSGWSIFPLAGAGGRSVPNLTAKDELIRWSPDGSAIYCFERAAVPAIVQRVDVATGARESVAVLGEKNRAGLVSILTVSMADDLQTLAYGTWRYASTLYTGARAPRH